MDTRNVTYKHFDMIIEIGMDFNLKCFHQHQLIKAHLEIMFNNNDGSDKIKSYNNVFIHTTKKKKKKLITPYSGIRLFVDLTHALKNSA